MKNNNSLHFSLNGITSILIGAYLFLAGFLIESILTGFVTDNHPLGMLSAEIIEFLIIGILISFFLFSSLAFFFKAKRNAKKMNLKLWNTDTKKAVLKYSTTFVFGFVGLILLTKMGFIKYITPAFLIFYSILTLLFTGKKETNKLLLMALGLFLALICFLIPSYWSAAISILAIAHITYGVVTRK